MLKLFFGTGTPVLPAQEKTADIRFGWAAALTLSLLVTLLSAYSLQQSRGYLVAEAAVDVRGVAHLIELSVTAQLDKSAMAVESVAARLNAALAAPGNARQDLWQVVDIEAQLAPAVQRIGVFDREGRQLCGHEVARCLRLNVADRDYFQRLRLHPRDPLALYGPHLSRIDGAWSLFLARALQRPDGTFEGVVTAVVPLANLTRLLSDLQLAPQEALSLQTGTTALLVRQNQPVALETLQARQAQYQPAITRRAATRAAPELQVDADGVERLSAARRFARYPLEVSVGRATAEYLQPWRREVAWVSGFCVVLTLLSLLGVRILNTVRQRESQQKWLYDTAPCGYHSLDAEGRLLHVNDTERAWLGGGDRTWLLGRRFTDFLTEESRATFAANYPQFKRTGRIDNLEFDLVNHDSGTVRRVLVNATTIHDRHGAFLMTNSVLYDITELHQARQRLQALMKDQNAILDNELVGFVKVSHRAIVWANQGMRHIFGYEPQELIGQTTLMLYDSPEAWAEAGQEAYPLLERGGHYRREIQLRARDGRLLWIDISGSTLASNRDESLWLMVDITARKLDQLKVMDIAFHDVLTGLPNRLLLHDRVQQALTLAARTEQHVAICLLDLNDFKPVNDTHGHHAGDRVLQEIAQRLQRCVRANDTVARLGGDEFVLVLSPIHDVAECQAIVGRALEAIEEPISLAHDVSTRVSCAIGVAIYPQDGGTLEVLLRHADQAMYGAKQSGAERVRAFSDWGSLA